MSSSTLIHAHELGQHENGDGCTSGVHSRGDNDMGFPSVETSPVDLLVAAIKMQQSETVRALVAQFPRAADECDLQDGATPAHWAALFGDVENLDYLSKFGAKLDRKILKSGMEVLPTTISCHPTHMRSWSALTGARVRQLRAVCSR